MKKIFLIILYIIIFSNVAYANEVMDEQLNHINFNGIQNKIDDIGVKDKNEALQNFDFLAEVKKLITGETDISIENVVGIGTTALIKEVKSNFILMAQILLLVILSAIIKNLTDSFENKEASEIAFYVCYVIIIISVIKTFKITIDIATTTIDNILSLMKVIIPVFISTIFTTGNITTATTANAVIFASINYIAILVKTIFLPVITYLSVVQIINFLSEKEILKELTDLIRKSVIWGLKGMVVIFLGLSAIQRFTAPVLDGITKKGVALTTKTIVPVLGDVMNSAVDTFINCTILIKNSVGIVAVIGLILICFIPLLKILAVIITYKLVAAIMQPIAESRVVKCFSEFGNNIAVIFACVLAVALCFVISISILITVGS
ncbi:MAG TPA: stage III sporulation protein AE [Clostridiales bacterium]|nr:MAG: stage III sporulation protein AE [Clostridiales bacterium GWD2_32_19]HCC06725.1 stage III sporulation protein AE [Clostridiales bacterium]